MRTMSLLLLSAALTGVGLSHAISAAETKTDQIAQEATKPVVTRSENPVFDFSARKVLGFVSEARVSIDNEQKETANAYIDESLRELNNIRNTRDYLEMMGVHFGRVLYREGGSYYIPIADDTYAVRTYARGPFWSPKKTTAVRDVELVNVDVAINPEKSTTHLQKAKDELNKNNYRAADKELKALLDESIHETASTAQPFARLQDNIYLTRILIRQQNYDGARYTLRHAKSALRKYERTLDTPQGRSRAKGLHDQIDALNELIQKDDPTLLKKAADTVDNWWEDLKAWTKDKTKG